MRWVRAFAIIAGLAGLSSAQDPTTGPISSIFDSGLAASLLQADTSPTITSVNSATDFGGFSTIAAGTWIEIKGTNFGGGSGSIWQGGDFVNGNAPMTNKGMS